MSLIVLLVVMFGLEIVTPQSSCTNQEIGTKYLEKYSYATLPQGIFCKP